LLEASEKWRSEKKFNAYPQNSAKQELPSSAFCSAATQAPTVEQAHQEAVQGVSI
jgi:hypothetical protein